MPPPKILFITSKIIIGGVERALINLLNELDKEKYEIHLLVLEEGGEWESLIPKGIKIFHLSTVLAENKNRFGVLNKLWSMSGSLFYRGMTHLFSEPCANAYFAVNSWPLTTEHYDCSILYKADHVIGLFVLSRIKSKKKVAWMHNSFLGTTHHSPFYKRTICKLDHIACVSATLRDEFLKVFPTYQGNVDVIHNILDTQSIQRSAEEDLDIELKSNSLITVGRLSEEKGQLVIPQTVRILLDSGINVYWYLVGDGPLRSEIVQSCVKYNVSKNVILLGAKQNPFPYVKKADIYVQTSITEGWCLTVQEAKILSKPIITTPLPVFKEQIVHGENGMIAESISAIALSSCIKELLCSKELCCALVNNNKNACSFNFNEISKFYKLIECHAKES